MTSYTVLFSRPQSARGWHVVSSPSPSAPRKEITKKHVKEKEEQRKARPSPTPRLRGATNEGVGRNSGSSSPTFNSSASTLRPLYPLRLPQPGPAFSWRGSLHSTAWLHLPSKRRSRILNRLFLLSATSHTSAHRISRWALHSGHTLKR